MGTIILILAFIVEAAFAAYCILTRSNQKRVRSYLRIGGLAAFVLFALVSVIEWSFRWYLLAALLFVWAVLGVWALMRKKPENKAYQAGRSVTRAIGTLLLVFVTILPAMIFPQYKLPPMTGTHPVATALFTYTDPGRIETYAKTGGNRQVNVEFWYPQDSGVSGDRYPLVVFDHGAFGMKGSNTSTFMDLASNGYVVCSIDHPYQSFITVGADGHATLIDPSYLQEFMNANNDKYDEATDLKLEQGWMNLRVADINFVLNTILQRAADSTSDPVYQLIDATRIGLMGHSLGGESSAEVARERVASGQKDISAVIDLDADLSGEYLGIQNGQPVINPEPYPVPILTIFSDTLVDLMAKVPNANETIAVRHILATSSNAYEIDLPGTDHMSLTDLPLISPVLVSLINTSVPKAGGQEATPYATIEKMNATVLQFFNVYLKGQGSFSVASR